MNVTASSYVREYSSGIPEFLHNRPKQVVQHCFKRWEEAGNYLGSDIDELGGGNFLVKSQNSPESMYHVSFNASGIGLPSCSCLDWYSNHLPCKHLFAVIRNVADWGWYSLPSTYINNAFLTLDAESLSLDTADGTSTEEVREDEVIDEEELPENAPVSELLLPSKARLAKARSSVGNLCAILRDYAYKCQDIEILRETATTLSESITRVKSSLPQTDDFVLEEGEMTSKTKKRKRSEKQNHTSPLPKRSRRKRWSGRHGIAAEKKRAASLVTSIEELHSHTEGSDILIEEGVNLLGNDEHLKDQNVVTETGNDIQIEEGVTDQQDKQLEDPNTATENAVNKRKRKGILRRDTDHPIVKKKVHFLDQQKGTLLDTIWGNHAVGYLMARVGTYNITDTALHQLKTCLPDEILDAYLYLLTTSQMEKKIFHFKCVTLHWIFQGKEEYTDYLNEIDSLKDFDIMIGGLNEGQSHWTLIVIYPKEEKIMYLNPLGESNRRLGLILQKWRAFLKGRVKRGKAESHDGWEVTTEKHLRQIDSTSCGVHVLQFAEKIIRKQPVSLEQSKRCIEQYRKEIGNVLLKNSDDMELYCRKCFNKETTSAGPLYNCRLCDEQYQMFHQDCSCLYHGTVHIPYKPKRKIKITKKADTVSKEQADADIEIVNEEPGLPLSREEWDSDDSEDYYLINMDHISSNVNPAYDRIMKIISGTADKDEPYMKRHGEMKKGELERGLRGYGFGLFSQQALTLLKIRIEKKFFTKKTSKAYATHGRILGMDDPVYLKTFKANKDLAYMYLKEVAMKEGIAAMFQHLVQCDYVTADAECSEFENLSLQKALKKAIENSEEKKKKWETKLINSSNTEKF